MRCPACGAETNDDATACPQCMLAVPLFDAVRDAAGPGDSDPKYLGTIAEILQAANAVTPLDPGGSNPDPRGATPLRPARFPSVPPATPPPPPSLRPPPKAQTELPQLRALPQAAELAVVRRQVEEYLQLARRQGLDVTDFDARARQAVAAEDRGGFDLLSRDLFVHLTAAISEEYEVLLGRRNDLATLVSTETPDVELDAARVALAAGDLGGAQRRLRRIADLLDGLEDRWAASRILATESDLLAETCIDLGEDPTPVLPPLAEGRRLAKEGNAAAAEAKFVQATMALWRLLSPRFAASLRELKEEILSRRGRGENVDTAVQALRDLTVELRHRNFGATILAYRRIRESLGLPAVSRPKAPAP